MGTAYVVQLLALFGSQHGLTLDVHEYLFRNLVAIFLGIILTFLFLLWLAIAIIRCHIIAFLFIHRITFLVVGGVILRFILGFTLKVIIIRSMQCLVKWGTTVHTDHGILIIRLDYSRLHSYAKSMYEYTKVATVTLVYTHTLFGESCT